MRKLRWRLMLSYLPVVLIPILLVGFVARGVAGYGINVWVTNEAEKRAKALVNAYAEYYESNGSWLGVETLFQQSFYPPGKGQPRPPAGPRPPDQEILITDASGRVVKSETGNSVGQVLSTDAINNGASIMVNGQRVGTLVIGAALGVLDQQQRQLLNTLNLALLVAGAVSALVAVLIGLWLSHTISAPVARLMTGVRALSGGEWGSPLPVYSRDELGELTQAFNRMAAEVTHQEQMRRQMVADVAHDLRTPLSIMSLEVEGIRAGMQTPEEATTSLQEEITWLQRLVEDLHTLSVLDANQATLQREPTPLSPFLSNVCEQWKPLADSARRVLCCEVPEGLPTLCIDPYRMRQVLGNLLDNALQHTGPTATVTLGAEHSGGNRAAIIIRDTGPGIAPADLPHLFDRFYRADRSRSRNKRQSGSGLGLSIAQQWVKLHGGEITVQSAPGRGTTFTVALPLSPECREVP